MVSMAQYLRAMGNRYIREQMKVLILTAIQAK